MEVKNKYSVEEFFDLFVKELENAPYLHKYYKFHTKDERYDFRKAYFIQRLQYILDHVNKTDKIWDCGCGYATTAIFLTLNGYKVFGSTLEFYYDDIEKRTAYWKQFGDLSAIKISYEDLFDDRLQAESFDTIIAQDTLHHLEPFNKAVDILSKALKKGGKLIAIEENGNSIIQNLKLYKQRGNKRIITIYDEKLKRDILIGNENIRSIEKWKKEFLPSNLIIQDNSVEYIRFYPPFKYKGKNITDVIAKEQSFKQKSSILKNYFFFGLNFIAIK